MVGPTPSFADVPLGEVLSDGFADAEDELRRLAEALESHPSALDQWAWHWYPEHRESPQSVARGVYTLLADATIMLYSTRDDWLELTLDIAWAGPSKLTVNAAVEVACWCRQDHNMHQVRQSQWHPANSRELVEAFAAAAAMLADVLATGPFDPRPWRIQAGLPDAPKPIDD